MTQQQRLLRLPGAVMNDAMTLKARSQMAINLRTLVHIPATSEIVAPFLTSDRRAVAVT